jgi:hypothetical protein
MAAAIIINKNKKKRRGQEHDNINDSPSTLYVSLDSHAIQARLHRRAAYARITRPVLSEAKPH